MPGHSSKKQRKVKKLSETAIKRNRNMPIPSVTALKDVCWGWEEEGRRIFNSPLQKYYEWTGKNFLEVLSTTGLLAKKGEPKAKASWDGSLVESNRRRPAVYTENLRELSKSWDDEEIGMRALLGGTELYEWDGYSFELVGMDESTTTPDTRKFSSGATRKEIKEAGHLVCPQAIRRVGLICGEGLKRYPLKDTEERGPVATNRGFTDEIQEADLTTAALGIPLANLIRHAEAHWLKYKSGEDKEDNLAKVVWACQQMMHQESHEGGTHALGQCDHYRMLVKFEEDRSKVL